jgi:hypothetical protein
MTALSSHLSVQIFCCLGFKAHWCHSTAPDPMLNCAHAFWELVEAFPSVDQWGICTLKDIPQLSFLKWTTYVSCIMVWTVCVCVCVTLFKVGHPIMLHNKNYITGVPKGTDHCSSDEY